MTSEHTRVEERLAVRAAMGDVTYVTLMPTMYRPDLRCTSVHIAVTTSGRQQTTAMHCEERRNGHLDLDL